MYVTGGIGSTAEGEAFTRDYDLPDATAYADPVIGTGDDLVPPTVWLPQRLPWNPGGYDPVPPMERGPDDT